MPHPETPIDTFLRVYREAVYRQELDTFLDLYADDVRIFDTWHSWTYAGVDAWRPVIAEWFASLGTDRVVVDFSDVRRHIAPPLAVAHTFVRYEAVSEFGRPLRALHNRMSLVLERRRDAWKVIHEHTSAPIEHESLKALLQRDI